MPANVILLDFGKGTVLSRDLLSVVVESGAQLISNLLHPGWDRDRPVDIQVFESRCRCNCHHTEPDNVLCYLEGECCEECPHCQVRIQAAVFGYHEPVCKVLKERQSRPAAHIRILPKHP